MALPQGFWLGLGCGPVAGRAPDRQLRHLSIWAPACWMVASVRSSEMSEMGSVAVALGTSCQALGQRDLLLMAGAG